MKNKYVTNLILQFEIEANSKQIAEEATKDLIPELIRTHVNCASSDPDKSYYLTTTQGYVVDIQSIKTKDKLENVKIRDYWKT